MDQPLLFRSGAGNKGDCFAGKISVAAEKKMVSTHELRRFLEVSEATRQRGAYLADVMPVIRGEVVEDSNEASEDDASSERQASTIVQGRRVAASAPLIDSALGTA